MASRPFLAAMKRARCGDVAAQISLGKAYLHGHDGAAANQHSALFWLARAAHGGASSVRQMIWEGIALEVARRSTQADLVLACYAQGGAAGSLVARWRYAQWALAPDARPQADRALAVAWLRELADGGHADAAFRLLLWLRAQPAGLTNADELARLARLAAGRPAASIHACAADPEPTDASGLLEQADALLNHAERHPDVIRRGRELLERAARAGLAEAQFRLGLWHGQLDRQARALDAASRVGKPSHTGAQRWLSCAAAQGHAGACFALACLYRNRHFTRYDVRLADEALGRAAALGHAEAQYQFGRRLWRKRGADLASRLEASAWLWRSGRNGVAAAAELLRTLIEPARPAAQRQWDLPARHVMRVPLRGALRLMGMRVRLAQAFGLERNEMLWLDPPRARHGHCLAVDVSAASPRTRPRLVLLETALQQRVLAEACLLFRDAEHAVAEGSESERRCRLDELLECARPAPGKTPCKTAGGVRTGNREPAYNAGSDTQPAARGANASHDDPARYLHCVHTGYPD
ncbi:tetratricopeptide repeat protein [Cupriavidus sp. 8B]